MSESEKQAQDLWVLTPAGFSRSNLTQCCNFSNRASPADEAVIKQSFGGVQGCQENKIKKGEMRYNLDFWRHGEQAKGHTVCHVCLACSGAFLQSAQTIPEPLLSVPTQISHVPSWTKAPEENWTLKGETKELLRHALEISKEYFASKGKTITRMELLEAAKQANDAVKHDIYG